MASPVVLLTVSLSLSDTFQALPHVLDLVSTFLLPRTIDSAVYNELHRVVYIYQHSRPYTVRAMDGAAALGKLSLVMWLYSNRAEGCSSVAFKKAAANCYLNVLKWLYEFYPEMANPEEEIVSAAERGHVDVFLYLQRRVSRREVERALEAAAATGHVTVLKALVLRPFKMQKSLLAAAGNGQAQVVQFLLDIGYCGRFSDVAPALMKAVEYGHYDVVELLIDKSHDETVSKMLVIAAANGRQDMVRLLLERRIVDKFAVARALEQAAENDNCDVAKLLAEHFNRDDEDRRFF